MSDVLVRHANYGLELIDALTNRAIVGSSRVNATLLAPPPPGTGANLKPYQANRTRWVFEELESDVELTIDADHYLSETLSTGSDLPAIPASSSPGVLVSVSLLPRSGYPFPASLTRATGMVRLDASVDPTTPVVAGAVVTVVPEYPANGTTLVTRTAEDGQYVVWFKPDLAQAQPLPVSFSASATATVEVGGVPTPVSGSLPSQPLTAQNANGAAVLLVS